MKHLAMSCLILMISACVTTEPEPVVVYRKQSLAVCPPKPSLYRIRSDELAPLSDVTKQKLLENQIRIKGHISELRTMCGEANE